MHRYEALFFLSVIAGQLLLLSPIMHGNVGPTWHGAPHWGPRYLYILIPFFAIALGPYIEETYYHFKKKLIFWFLFSIGLLIQLPPVVMRIAGYTELVIKYNLGDANFTPMLSPVIGGWLLLISSIKKVIAGNSLIFKYYLGTSRDNYVTKIVNFENYDYIDLWFSHVFIKFQEIMFIKLAITGILILLFSLIIFSINKIKNILFTQS